MPGADTREVGIFRIDHVGVGNPRDGDDLPVEFGFRPGLCLGALIAAGQGGIQQQGAFQSRAVIETPNFEGACGGNLFVNPIPRFSSLGQVLSQGWSGDDDPGFLALQFGEQVIELGSAVGMETGIEEVDQYGGVENNHLFIPPQTLEFGLGVFHGVPFAALDGAQGGNDFSQWCFVQRFEALYVEVVEFPVVFLSATPFS